MKCSRIKWTLGANVNMPLVWRIDCSWLIEMLLIIIPHAKLSTISDRRFFVTKCKWKKHCPVKNSNLKIDEWVINFGNYLHIFIGATHTFLNRTVWVGLFHLAQFRCKATGETAQNGWCLLGGCLDGRLCNLVHLALLNRFQAMIDIIGDLAPNGDTQFTFQFACMTNFRCQNRAQSSDFLFDASQILYDANGQIF